jgi:glutamate dehydrogenase
VVKSRDQPDVPRAQHPVAEHVAGHVADSDTAEIGGLAVHADVGDRANDAVRIDGRELRCTIVGEGGNLGFTQLGRLEFALAGGHINTDAIDNSAGVDTSDHEVNIKILLDVAARSGRLTAAERGPLLASMTDEIAELVLRDNYAQNLMLACSQAQAGQTLHLDAGYIETLEKSGLLSRSLEHLPSLEEIAERHVAGLGLARPEIAVLLAYAKIITGQEIVDSDLADDIFAHEALVDYFPTPLRERFAADMAAHPLLREIIATQLANQIVNYSGATFVATLERETSAATADIVRAHTATRQVFGVDTVWHDIEALDDIVDAKVQTAMLLGVRGLLDRGTRWFLTNRRQPLDVPETVAQFGSRIAGLLDDLPAWLRGDAATRFAAYVEELTGARVPSRLARRLAAFDEGLAALAVVEVARRVEADVDEVAEVHFTLGDVLRLGVLDAVVAALPADSRWHALARTAARDDLLLAHAELTTDVLVSTPSGIGAEKRISTWQQANSAAVARAGSVLNDIVVGDGIDLAALSVALREVRALVRTASLPSR